MKYLVVGEGVMGQLIKAELIKKGHEVHSVSFATELPQLSESSFDGLIDFSHPDNLAGILTYLESSPCPTVIATTGYSPEQVEAIQALAKKVPLVYSGNYSIGVTIMKRLVKEMQDLLGSDFDIEIIEKHHRKKIDAPSGTANMLAEALKQEDTSFVYGREGISPRQKNEIGIHSLRGGTIVGEHEVIFAGEDEVLSLKHEAHSKMIFANGAIRALEWLGHQEAGIYSFEDVIFSEQK